MLARPTETTSSEMPAPDAGMTGGARLAAFGRAQRHSRLVRVLKLAVPLTAAAIAIAFPLYSYLAAPAAAPVEADGSAYANGKLVMANPKLEGFTKQNLPYLMKAVRAVQEVNKEGIVHLEGIDAKLPISAENEAAIEAANGVYNRDTNTLTLNKDITVETTDGLVAKLQSAYLDIGQGDMKTDDPIDITRQGSRITSGTMTVHDSGKILIFEKNVRVNIDPARTKAAGQQSGDTNATQ